VKADFPVRFRGRRGQVVDGFEQLADAGVGTLDLALQFGQLVGERPREPARQ